MEQEKVEMMSSLVKIGRCLIQIHDGLSKMLFYAAGVLLFFMALAISYEVIMRYFFNQPTVWVMDFSEYALIYSTFMAAPWILKIGGHVSVSAVVDALRGRPRDVVEALAAFIGIVVCAIVAYNGIQDTLDVYRNGIMIVRPVIVPKFMIFWIIPFGLILLMFYLVRSFVKHARAVVGARTPGGNG